MELIYLDYNCFQRGFDDPRQLKIRLEALVCEEIFTKAEREEVELVWSFMHEDENALCPFIERKLEVLRLSSLCKIRISPEEEIYTAAKGFQNKAGLSSKDAIHLACSHSAGCTFFLTCDEGLIKRAKRLNLSMRIVNPVDYIREVGKNESATV
jgi:predicted nucleic acid-binding protein